ncbi:GOLPH3/VPS74 family protein [Streptomyces montanisoli]|uniref:GPP34 family phosphoprotein n=1 Tax=Streptomyces montanisoli TaxID=2798581 RepID=A0A940RYK2_9ACTN|nr:GPP34 family phosphoprotein [Streptomyces montanisoli]MBP0461466.1 GPP34 family phosphoprotein [Streptomyces montanisoli]
MNETLPQRLYLLGYDVDKGTFRAVDLQGRGQLLRAGALAEMAVGGLLCEEDGKAVPSAGSPPGDAFLAEVWGDVTAGKPRSWFTLVHHKAYEAESAVREQLAAAGAVTPAEGRSLNPLSTHQVTVNDVDGVKALRDRVRDTALSGADPASLLLDDVVMAVLAAASDEFSVFGLKERFRHRRALGALDTYFDGVVPGLRTALRASVGSSRAYGGGWGK